MNKLYLFWHKLCLIAVLLGFMPDAHGQSINNYQFSTNTTSSLTRTYGSLIDDVDMNTGTTIITGGSLPLTSTPTLSTNIPMPFDFFVNGTRVAATTSFFYTTTSGWVFLGSAAAANTTFGPTSNFTGARLAPFLGSMGTSAWGRIHYKVVGTQPSRVLVVEFMNMTLPYNSVTYDTNTFQVRLYENDGSIEYVYGRMFLNGASAQAYNTGIHLGNGTSASYYQHVNTSTHTVSGSSYTANNYLPGEITALSGRVLGSQRAYRWVPAPPDDPFPLVIDNITSNSMRLTWTDPSNNLGFALYRSMDGSNYTLYGQYAIANGFNTFTINNLIANTTYYWRIYAYRESISVPAEASAQTLPASKYFTTASGNWSNPNIWNTLAVPGTQDSAEISAGDDVVLDQFSHGCGTLIVKGSLQYWNSTNNQTFTISGDVIVETGGSFTAGLSTGASITPNLYLNIGGNSPTGNVSGSLVVNGTLDLQTTNNVVTTFYGNQNATVSGTGTTCELPFITCNKGTDTTVFLEFLRTYTQASSTPTQTNTQRLMVSAGTLKISAPVVTNSFFNATLQLAYAALTNTSSRLWLNHPGINIGVVPGLTNGANPLFLRGELRIDAGSLTTGVGNTICNLNQSSILRLNGGTFTHYGALSAPSTTPSPEVIIAGGDLVLDPQGTVNIGSSTTPILNIQTSANFTFSSGNITIVDPHPVAAVSTLSSLAIQIVSGGIKSVTGGTFRIGNGVSNSSGAAVASYSGFGLNIGIPVHNLTISNLGATNTTRYCRLVAGLIVNNTLTIENNGYLSTSGSVTPNYSLSVLGNVVNNGLLTSVMPGSTVRYGTVDFIGTAAQAVSGTGTASYLSTRISNPAGVSFSNTGTWVMEKITLERGNVTNASSAIQIGNTTPLYNGTIAIGGLNESTAAGSFSLLPGIPVNATYVYGPASNALTTGSFNEMGSGSQTVQGITVNDLQGLTANRSLDVTSNLTLTEGKLNMGNNALTLGVSTTSTGTLTRTNGFVVLGAAGTFKRYLPAANYTYTYNLGFPLSSGTYDRSILFSGFVSSGFEMTVAHENAIGYTDLTPGFTDNSIAINRRTNSNWTFTGTNPSLFTNFSIRLMGEGIGAITNYEQLVLMNINNTLAAGTTTNGTPTNANPGVNREFTSGTSFGSAMYNGPVYIGTNNGVNPLSPTITAINTGNWNDVNTWEAGIIPTITNNAIIAPGVTVTIPASYTATCNGLNISAGATVSGVAGTLNNAGSIYVDGTLINSGTAVNIVGSSLTGVTINAGGTVNISGGTFNIGPTGGGNRKILLDGTLNVTGGTLVVNGNIEARPGSTFNQSAGDINIDGNDGTLAGSVANTEHLLHFSSGPVNIACSGGTITIVDPPYGNSTFALRIVLSAGSLTAFTGSHTLRLGDGTSSTTTGNPFGFIIDTKRGSGRVPLQNLVVNGGSGTGRWVSDATSSAGSTHIKGNVTINAGSELRHTTTSSNFAIGGDITNNGTMTMAAPLILGGEGYVITNAQAIDGSGTFRNSTTSSTGAFTSLNVNNGTGLTLNTANKTFGITGTLTLGALNITTNSNTVVMGASGTISRTSGYIVGNLGKTLAVGNSNNYTFEIGTSTDYLPVTINTPAVTTSGVIAFGINNGAHPQLASSCINPAKMINRYWKVSKTGLVSTGGNYTFNFLPADLLGSPNLALAKTFAYNGTDWTGGITGSGSTSSYTINGLNLTGDLAVGEIIPIPTSVTISATPSGAICTGTSVQFSAVITNGGSAPTYQWKVNGTNVATTATYTSAALASGDVVTCEIVSNNPCVVTTGATSNAITMTVNPLTVPGDVAGGSTICSGSTSGTLTLSGHTGSVQRWQYSVAPFSSWNDTTITTTSFTSGSLNQTIRYRAVVKSGACAEAFSDTTEVVVNEPSAAPAITGNSSVCSGSNAGNLTLPLTGRVGTILRWETATNATFTANFTSTSSSSATFAAGSPTQTTYYRAIVKNGVCVEAASPTHTITVNAASVGGSVSSTAGTNQTICAGGTVTRLDLTGQVGSVIKWQSSANASFTSPTDIASTSTQYTPSTPSATTYYRAVVSNAGCAEANSSAASVTVNPAPGGGNINGPSSVCSGSGPGVLELQAGYTGTLGAWQYQTAATAPAWTATGTTGSTQHNPGALTVATKFRVQLTNAGCADGYSNEISIGVDAASSAGTVSGSQTICAGGTVTAMTLQAGYVGTIQKWQSSTDAAFTSPTDIAHTNASYTPASAPSVTTYYRAVVKNGACSTANSSSASITVTAASVGGSVSSNQSICPGGSVSALTLTGHTGSVTKWQSSSDAAFTTPSDIALTSGLTSYTPSSPSSTTYYRAVVANGSCAAANSSSASVTVNPASVGGSVSSNQSICPGGSVSALTLTGHTGSVTKWQSSSDAAFTTPSDIALTSGLTSYTPSSPSSTTYYRAVVANGSCAAANSSSASVTVNPASVGGSVSSPVSSVCSGSTSGLLTSGGRTGNVVHWLSATAPFDFYTAITSATGNTYTSGTLSATTRFRVLVQNGTCTPDTSGYFEVTVNNTANAGTLTNNGASAVCQGSTGPSLQLNGYSGTIQKWESASAPGFVYSDISGQTSASYSTGTLNRTTRYRVTVNNPGCTATVSNEITVNVDSLSLAGSATTTSSSICAGTAPAQFSLTGTIRGTVTRWDSSATSPYTTFSAIPFSGGSTYTSPALTATTHFRAVVQNGVCPAANSAPVAVTVTPGSVAGTISGSTPVCNGSSTTLSLSGSSGTIMGWIESTSAPFTTYSQVPFSGGQSSISPSPTGTARYRVIVANGSCPADTAPYFEVEVVNSGIWTGIFNSNWNDPLNWCGGVPTASTNVSISSGTPFSPIINTAAVANNLTIAPGATLSFASTSNSLTLGGNLVVDGSFSTNGIVVFNGTSAQNVAGIPYSTLRMNGTGAKTITGNVTVGVNLDLTSGLLNLGSFDLTLNGTVTGASSNSYVNTNGTGSMKKYLPLTTLQTFPVGSGSYTPLVITNNGTSADTIIVTILPNCHNSYSGFTGTSPMSGQKVVDRTFIVTESTAGGSLLDIQFTWNSSDIQNVSMDKTQMVVGHYTTTWNHATTVPQNIGVANSITLTATALTGIFGVGDVTSPLPVRLLSFTAKLNKGVTNLNWVTASETNNSHFEIERGTDGYNFEKIGRVEGKGNTGRRIDYTFRDLDAAAILETSDVVYYRLKQFNFNGDFDYSGVVSVSEFKNSKFDVISTVPNPFVTTTTIKYKTNSTGKVDMTVTDAFGKVVSTGSILPAPGSNNIEVGVNNQWAAGVYFIKLTQDNTTKVIRVVKQ